MDKKLKFFFSFLIRLGVSIALLWWLFGTIDIPKTQAALRSSDLNQIAWAGIVFFCIYGILLLRWIVFIQALGLKAPFSLAFRYYAIGLFGNLFLPSAIGGDLIKIYGLCKNSSEKPKVVASVLLDRLSGYAGLVIVATIAFMFGFQVIQDFTIVLAIILLAGLWSGIMAVLFNEKLYSLCCRVFSPFPKVKQGVMQMHYDIALLEDKRGALLKTVGLSCLTQMIYAFVFFLLAKGLHQHVGMIYFFIFVPLICVAAAFPSIGGLGIREMGAAYLFTKVGVPSGIAVSMSLINFLFMMIVGLLGGVVYVATIYSRRVQYHQPDSQLSPKDA